MMIMTNHIPFLLYSICVRFNDPGVGGGGGGGGS